MNLHELPKGLSEIISGSLIASLDKTFWLLAKPPLS